MSLWAIPSLLSAVLAASLAAALIWKRTDAPLLLKLLPVLVVSIWTQTINGISLNGVAEVLWWRQLSLVGELMLPVALGYVAHSFYRLLAADPRSRSPWWWRGMAGAAVLLVLGVILYPTSVMKDDVQGAIVFIRPYGRIIWGGILLTLVWVLSRFEQILRAVRDPLRFQLKFVLIGLGGLAGMAIVQASQMLLLPIWNPTFVWVGGAATSISLLLIGLGVARWRLQVLTQKIQVSHQALYASLTFFLVGGYLISVGLVTEILQQTGWALSEALAALFVFVASLFFVSVLVSRQVRLEIQQFVARHFFRSKYDYRQKWVEVTETFSSCHDLPQIWDQCLQWLSRTFYAPRITIWKRFEADGRFHQIRTINSEDPSPPIDDSHPLLSQLLKTGDPFLVDEQQVEAESGQALREFCRVTRALVCVPIVQSPGHLLGFCTLSCDPHGRGYDHDDFDLLRVAAHHVAMLVLQFQLQEERTASAKWEAVHRFSAFYLHDLKNLASSLSMVAQNADQYGDDPDFQASAMRTIRNSSQRIMELMGNIAGQTKTPVLTQPGKLMPVDLNALVSEALQGVNGTGCQPTFQPGSNLPLVRGRSESIKQVVLNLVINARQAMGHGGTIDISTAVIGQSVVLAVADTGHGIPPDQVEYLFEPFRSQKTTGMGVGLFQCKRMIEDMHGTIRVKSEMGQGTKIIVTFPVVPADNP